jgi:hypothetical protein
MGRSRVHHIEPNAVAEFHFDWRSHVLTRPAVEDHVVREGREHLRVIERQHPAESKFDRIALTDVYDWPRDISVKRPGGNDGILGQCAKGLSAVNCSRLTTAVQNPDSKLDTGGHARSERLWLILPLRFRRPVSLRNVASAHAYRLGPAA